MRNTRKITDDGNKDAEGKAIEENFIDEYVSERERFLETINSINATTTPITMRLSMFNAAQLDHLVKRWRTTRSALACSLLEEMIPSVLRRVYMEKTPDEFGQLQTEIMTEFHKKRKVNKRKKDKE